MLSHLRLMVQLAVTDNYVGMSVTLVRTDPSPTMRLYSWMYDGVTWVHFINLPLSNFYKSVT